MKVSVIVTCYNQEAFLNESLGSVARQTYRDWECIIIDDGSTDTSAQIAKSWQEKDARFRYFYQENKKVSGARNAGLSKVEGDLIQFLDGDDILLPTKLEESVKAFSREKCDVVVTNFSEEHHANRVRLFAILRSTILPIRICCCNGISTLTCQPLLLFYKRDIGRSHLQGVSSCARRLGDVAGGI